MITPDRTAHMASVHGGGLVWGVPIHEPSLPILDSSDSVLDIGSGTRDSQTLSTILNKAEGAPCVVRLDYSWADLLKNPGQGRIRGYDAVLPIASSVMSAVVTSELTPDNRYFGHEELPEQERNRLTLSAEIARVLRIGGRWVAYNENISLRNNRPPGLATIYRRHDPVQIAARHMSHQLPFAVFEKIAEPIDTALIGRHATIEARQYADDYTRALDEIYPVARIIGEEMISAVRRGDVSALDKSHPIFPVKHDRYARSTLIESAKAGRWVPKLIELDYRHPESRLEKLAGPHDYELTDDWKNPRRENDNILRQLQHHVRIAEKWAVILPAQQLTDEFVDFRDTTFNAEHIQIRM